MADRIRKIAIVALLVGAVPLGAVERATFILTSSERISGPVVFHGGDRENMIAGNLNLGAANGKEETFAMDQVAVIDFIGGTPSNKELAALPASGHLIAMRDGTTRGGQFVNMIGGDTVKWRESDGNVRDLPIRDVARIYLNPGSARNTFNYNPAAAAAATGAAAPAVNTEGISVRADKAWTDTGMVVQRGQALRFTVRGEIQYAPGASNIAGPGGSPNLKSPNYPVAAMNGGALVGKIGNGAAFPIGAGQAAVVMPEDGTLMLGINDDDTSDNTGAFFVTITSGATPRRR